MEDQNLAAHLSSEPAQVAHHRADPELSLIMMDGCSLKVQGGP